jgi:hypothetical protein
LISKGVVFYLLDAEIHLVVQGDIKNNQQALPKIALKQSILTKDLTHPCRFEIFNL